MTIKKIIALVLCLLMFSSCGTKDVATEELSSKEKEEEKDAEYQQLDLVDIESFYNSETKGEARKRYTDFCFNLLRNSYKENDNEIISPYSLYNALALLANGAQGRTRQEFENVFNMTIEDTNKYIFDYNNSYRNEYSNTFNIASGVWFNTEQGLKLSDEFTKIADEFYYSGAINKDFSNPSEVVNEINNWSKDKTNGAIDNVTNKDDIDDSTVFFLVNALATGGKWDFDPSKTKLQQFNNYDGSKTDTAFMNKTISNWWHDDYSEGFVYILDNFTEMVAILPNEGIDVYEYLDIVNGDVFKDFLSGKIYYDNIDEKKYEADIHLSNISFPKFEYTKDYDLKDAITNMGLGDVFDFRTCDFSGMAAGEKELVDELQVDKVGQKAQIYVDEKEVRAAAVTVVEGGLGAAGYSVRNTIYHDVVFDRPFVFAIITMDETPLFIGAVTNFSDISISVNSTGTNENFSGKELEVIADNIKIRKEPSLHGEHIGKVSKGAKLPYTLKTSNDGYTWYQIDDNKWIADKNGEWIKEIN